MSYGSPRFLYNNFITSASMITPTTVETGIVTGVSKTKGTGYGRMIATGAYTGSTTLLYTVEIDSVTSGTQVGQATYRWKTSDTVSGWEASGVTTSTALTTLNNAVKVAYADQTSTSFQVGDTNVFQALASYGVANLIDWQRDTVFRSTAVDAQVIDLGSPQNVKVFVLYGHNLTSGVATLTLQANTADSWGAPAYSQAIAVNTGFNIFYLDQTYRYWRIVPVDAGLSYVEYSQIYLGDYLQLDRTHASWGVPHRYGINQIQNINEAGVLRRHALTQQEEVTLNYPILSNTDIDSILTMQTAMYDTSTGVFDRMFLHLFYDDLTDDCILVDWLNMPELTRQYRSYLLNSGLSLTLTEVAQTRRA